MQGAGSEMVHPGHELALIREPASQAKVSPTMPASATNIFDQVYGSDLLASL